MENKMQVTLKPDNRKATIVGEISAELVRVKLEDGREVPWRKDRINEPPKEGEETLKLVVVPAIDRLEEFITDLKRIDNANGFRDNTTFSNQELKLFDELLLQSEIDLREKWGLT